MRTLVRLSLLVSLFLPLSFVSRGADVPSKETGPRLLIRTDDIGMCHAVNMALEKVVASGLPFSASVMFACPWYQEAVDILKNAPNVSVGVHLTLNAEWKNYRWGPIAGAAAVPSLVDSCGYFFPTRKALFDNQPRLEEVERELRAQIERARKTGLAIDYLDYHMGSAVQTPELRELVERLAKEYRLGISRYFGEEDVEGLYDAPANAKIDTVVSQMKRLKPGIVNLLVFHIGIDTPEMQALHDMNATGLPEMSKHRNGELSALTSEKVRNAIRELNVDLVSYRDLIGETGLDHMQRPAEK